MGLFNRQHEAQKNADHNAWVKASNARRDAGRKYGTNSRQYKIAEQNAKAAATKAQQSAKKFWGK